MATMRRGNSALVLLALAALLSGCATGMGGDRGSSRVSEGDRALFEQAMVLLAEERYPQGIEMLETLVGRNPSSVVPYINLAVAYRKTEQLDKAEKFLLMALDKEPQNPVANNEYGLVLRKKGDFDAARKTYQGVLKRYPEFALANKNLGVLCDIYMRDYPCAMEAYQAYSAVVPEDEEVQIWIDDLQWRLQ